MNVFNERPHNARTLGVVKRCVFLQPATKTEEEKNQTKVSRDNREALLGAAGTPGVVPETLFGVDGDFAPGLLGDSCDS